MEQVIHHKTSKGKTFNFIHGYTYTRIKERTNNKGEQYWRFIDKKYITALIWRNSSFAQTVFAQLGIAQIPFTQYILALIFGPHKKEHPRFAIFFFFCKYYLYCLFLSFVLIDFDSPKRTLNRNLLILLIIFLIIMSINLLLNGYCDLLMRTVDLFIFIYLFDKVSVTAIGYKRKKEYQLRQRDECCINTTFESRHRVRIRFYDFVPDRK